MICSKPGIQESGFIRAENVTKTKCELNPQKNQQALINFLIQEIFVANFVPEQNLLDPNNTNNIYDALGLGDLPDTIRGLVSTGNL